VRLADWEGWGGEEEMDRMYAQRRDEYCSNIRCACWSEKGSQLQDHYHGRILLSCHIPTTLQIGKTIYLTFTDLDGPVPTHLQLRRLEMNNGDGRKEAEL